MHALKSEVSRRSCGTMIAALVGAAGLAAPATAQWIVIKLNPAWATNVDTEAQAISGAQQVGTVNTGSHALLWSGSSASVVTLDPTVDGGGTADGAAGGRQGGSIQAYPGTPNSQNHASLWSGSAQSWIDIHPTVPGVVHSGIYCMDAGGTQGGYFFLGSSATFGTGMPCMWSGTADSFVDLTPAGYGSGAVIGMSGNEQVGATYDQLLGWACLWHGTPDSFVNLNPDPNFFSSASCTDGTHQYGVGVVITQLYSGLYPVQWTGTPESMLDMGVDDPINRWGEIHATHGGWQVGYTTDTDGASNERACYWTGLPGTFADLNQYLPAPYTGSNALGIWRHTQSGSAYVVGYADNGTTGHREAVMWVNSSGVNLITSPAAPADCAAGAGGTMPYSVRVLNAGSVSSGVVTLTVALPPSGVATYASASPPPTTVTASQLTFTLGPIAGAGAFTDVSINLHAVGAGSTATITATATTAGEVDPTNNTGSASSRIEPDAPPFALAAGVASTLVAQSNSLIPGGAGHYTTLHHPWASPSGNWWLVNADTDQASAQNSVIVRTATGGAGSIVVQKGLTPTPHGTMSSMGMGAEVNDSGLVAFSGVDSTSSAVVATTGGGPITERARQGDPIPSLPGFTYVDVDNSANIFANGQVGFAASTNPAGSDSYLSDNGNTVLATLGVTTPAGASAPVSAIIRNNTGVWGLAIDATGTHSIYQADINTGDETNNQVIVADGTVVIQEGVTVLPGFSDPVGPGDTGGNKFLSMGPAGTWMVRGTNEVAYEDWVARGDGTTLGQVFKVGDPICTGTTEAWKTDTVSVAHLNTFFAQVADANGYYVIGGTTDNPDTFADSVLVYNNRVVVARENDPVDLDGNGLFDDGVYIRSFDADGVTFVTGGILAVVTLRDAEAALCHTNNTSLGQAVVFIPLCPADFDHNGFVNGDDFDQFSLLFFYGDPGADFDGNGFVNGDDFDQFSQHFFDGC